MYEMTGRPTPGLIQMYPGFGDYVQTNSYFLTPAGQAGIRGLGCGGPGHCGCHDCGMGLFDNGITDIASWGLPEYLTAGLGLYVLGSVLFATKSTARAVHRKGKAVRKALRA